MNVKFASRRVSAVPLGLWALFAATSFAEDTESEAEDGVAEASAEASADVETVVVTGTRLPGYSSASPVYVLNREDMDRRGLLNVEEVLRFLPQNFSSILSGGSYDGNSPRFTQGSVTANLRGLGEGATLVLVNGRRIAASPAENGTFTDISTIPFSAIERVEVVADGASAIYGSDAVGGVVNFILKKDYRGAETALRYESSSSGGDRRVFEQTGGASWASGNITASFNYSKEDAVYSEDAGLDVDGDFRDQGGRRFPSTFSQPATLLRFAGFPPGAPPGTRVALLPPGDGTNIDVSRIIYVSNQEWETQSGNFNLLPAAGQPLGTAEATPSQDHKAAYLNLSQQLGEQLVLDVSATWAEQEVVGESFGTSFSGVVPESNAYNTLGTAVYVGYAFNREVADGKLARFSRITDSDRQNLSASLTWTTPWRDVTVVVSADRGENGFYNGYGGTFNSRSPAFRAALASSDPQTAINPFGDGTVQPVDLSQFVEYDTRGSRSGRNQVFGVSASGTLFEIAGGAAQLAFGIERRTDTLDFEDFGLNPFTFRTPNAPEIVPEAENAAWFFELSVPLIGEANARPGMRGFTLHFAGRSDDYEIDGPFDGPTEPASVKKSGDFVPKVSVTYYPVDDVKLRATWGEGFQTPTLPELFTPPRMFNPPHTPPFFPTFDPANPESNGGRFTPVFPVTVFGGNPNLEAQTSETTTIGMDWAPAAVEGLYLSATWISTDFVNLIGDLQAALGWPPTYALENSEQFPGLVERDANGVLTLLSFASGNLAARVSETLDLEGRYRFGTAWGDFGVGFNLTRTFALETTPVVGADPVTQHGTQAGPPKLRTNAWLDWTRGPWAASFTVKHKGGYRNTEDGALKTDVDSYTTFDLRGERAFPEFGLRLSAGVDNVFDADFPFVDNRSGVNSRDVDFRRRVAFLKVVKEFSW